MRLLSFLELVEECLSLQAPSLVSGAVTRHADYGVGRARMKLDGGGSLSLHTCALPGRRLCLRVRVADGEGMRQSDRTIYGDKTNFNWRSSAESVASAWMGLRDEGRGRSGTDA